MITKLDMDNDLKEYIFAYLDKRHRIESNVVYLKDNVVGEHISYMFGLNNGYIVFSEWIRDRVGNSYVIITPNGIKTWNKNGLYHREDGPAIIYPNGEKHWWLNGKRHRVDGPAVIYSDGGEYWYLNDTAYRKEMFNEIIKNGHG